eukprot:scaffold125153_cov30-Tisochrysis_lutea.AAC.1
MAKARQARIERTVAIWLGVRLQGMSYRMAGGRQAALTHREVAAVGSVGERKRADAAAGEREERHARQPHHPCHAPARRAVFPAQAGGGSGGVGEEERMQRQGARPAEKRRRGRKERRESRRRRLRGVSLAHTHIILMSSSHVTCLARSLTKVGGCGGHHLYRANEGLNKLPLGSGIGDLFE